MGMVCIISLGATRCITYLGTIGTVPYLAVYDNKNYPHALPLRLSQPTRHNHIPKHAKRLKYDMVCISAQLGHFLSQGGALPTYLYLDRYICLLYSRQTTPFSKVGNYLPHSNEQTFDNLSHLTLHRYNTL